MLWVADFCLGRGSYSARYTFQAGQIENNEREKNTGRQAINGGTEVVAHTPSRFYRRKEGGSILKF